MIRVVDAVVCLLFYCTTFLLWNSINDKSTIRSQLTITLWIIVRRIVLVQINPINIKIGYIHFLGIGVELLAYNGGTCEGISFKRDWCHLHLGRVPTWASVSCYLQCNADNTNMTSSLRTCKWRAWGNNNKEQLTCKCCRFQKSTALSGHLQGSESVLLIQL